MNKTNSLPKIEKGIPFPKEKNAGICEFLKSMAIGDSFLCDRHLQVTCSGNAKQAGIKVLTRKTADGTQVRVWRVK